MSTRRVRIRTTTGNLDGLKPSQKKALDRTFHRRVPKDQLITKELARHLSWLTADIGRQIGVLIDRRGQIEHVFVGDPHRIYLPEVGRLRAGGGLLRGLRHVHTTLQGEGLAKEDIADLSKLRLDMVAVLDVTADGDSGAVHYATLKPGPRGAPSVQQERARSVHDLDVDVFALVQAVEDELARTAETHADTGDGVRAVLVGVYPDKATSEWRLAELRELASTAGVAICDEIVQVRRRTDPKFVVGKGKLEEVVLRCLDHDVDVVIMDHNMTPAQARAVAAFSELKVLDRTQLILDIFAQHAKSRDGKLQVELAQLKYNLPRLTDLDAGLSRLTGGIGGRGPGETKLEINRRRARDRISRLEREIERISKQRGLRRSKRQQNSVPVISLVGYTNAGKSTLLNRLTQSEVIAEDKLFATLDPASRRLRFPREREAVITDTVGFIRDLPPDLMKAFRATLEELENADLLVHVVDAADPSRADKEEAVASLLKDLHLGEIPQLILYNKADLLDDLEQKAMRLRKGAMLVSAESGGGVADLVKTLADELWRERLLADDDPWVTENETPAAETVTASLASAPQP